MTHGASTPIAFARTQSPVWLREKNSMRQNLDLLLDEKGINTPTPQCLMWGICKRSMCSVTQSCPTLCDPMDCSPPGSSVHGIFQARILECVAISSSRGSSRPKDQICIFSVSCIGRHILYQIVKITDIVPLPNLQIFVTCCQLS